MKAPHVAVFALTSTVFLALTAAPTVSLAQEPELLEEIIVTAQRREQNIQDVPISIDAFSGELLEAAGIQNFQGLADLAPSLTILGQNGWTGALDVRLRGQGGTAFNRDPGVGLYINEAYVSEATSVMSSFVDVERVETLKGPQGTLWGRVTLGGAMNIVLKEPGSEFEGEANATLGDYGTRRLNAAVSGPISETLSGRLSVTYGQQDHYVENGVNPDTLTQDLLALRGFLMWKPSEKFSAKLTLSDADNDSANPFLQGAVIVPGTPIWALNQIYDLNIDNDIYTVETDSEQISTHEETFAILNMRYDFNDTWSIKSITSRFDTESNRLIDLDGTSAPMAQYPGNTTNESFSQELAVNYDGERVRAVAGLYRFDQEWFLDGGFRGNADLAALANCNTGITSGPFAGTIFTQAFLAPILGFKAGECTGFYFNLTTFALEFTGRPPFPAYYGPGGIVEGIIGRPLQAIDFAPGGVLEQQGLMFFGNVTYNAFTNLRDVASDAAYANFEVDIGKRWTLTFGGRYTDEEISVFQDGANYFGFPVTGQLSTFERSNAGSFDEITGRIGIEFRAAEDKLLYLNWSEGFTSGEFNPSLGILGPPQLLDAYEVGLKSLLFGGKMVFNAAAFLYNYSNFTTVVRALDPDPMSSSPVTSVPVTFDSVHTTGIEFDISLQATDNLSLTLDFMSIDPSIEDYNEEDLVSLNLLPTISGLAGNDTINFETLNIIRAPETSATLGATYDYSLSGGGKLSFTGTAAWTDGYCFDLYNELCADSKTLTNVGVRYTPGGDSKWWLNLYSNNVFDKQYLVSQFYYFEYGLTQYPGAPRQSGLQFGIRF